MSNSLGAYGAHVTPKALALFNQSKPKPKTIKIKQRSPAKHRMHGGGRQGSHRLDLGPDYPIRPIAQPLYDPRR